MNARAGKLLAAFFLAVALAAVFLVMGLVLLGLPLTL